MELKDYARWDEGTGKELNEMSVVVFGDEGGIHVAAETFCS